MLLAIAQLQHSVFGPVDLMLDTGEIVCVSGPSGSGKSILLRCVADLEIHTGDVALDGKPMNSIAAHLWRRDVGMLPAESQWWFTTVGQHFRAPNNIDFTTLGLRAEVVDWRVDRLSSGEKQRLAFFRLLENQPKVLLLDEPTANLDRKMTEAVERLMQEQVAKGVAVLLVSHNPEQIQRVAHRHYELNNRLLALATAA